MTSLSAAVPESTSDLQQLLIERSNARQPTRLVSRFVAEPGNLSLQAFHELIDYPCRDMTVTIQAGMTVAELQAVLREQGQWLPLDVPDEEQTTIAEAVLFHLYGSLSEGYGTLRDCLLGMTACDARGRLFHAGGRVVKNVAGYDLCKMLIGSGGTWAIPVEVTFRVQPLPDNLRILLIQPESDDLAETAWNTIRQQSLPLVVFDHDQPTGIFRVGLAGRAVVTGQLIHQLGQSLQQAGLLFQQEERAWNSELSGWHKLSNQSARTDILRWGLRPSQVVDCLARLNRLGLQATALAGRGVVLGNAPIDMARSLREDLEQLARELSATSHWPGNSTKPASDYESTIVDLRPDPLGLSERWKNLFDPHHLFPSG